MMNPESEKSETPADILMCGAGSVRSQMRTNSTRKCKIDGLLFPERLFDPGFIDCFHLIHTKTNRCALVKKNSLQQTLVMMENY